MIFAYIDDTGDDGDPAKNGSTNCFGLGCLLIEAESWAEAHEKTVQFRKSVRDSLAFPFVPNSKPISSCVPAER